MQTGGHHGGGRDKPVRHREWRPGTLGGNPGRASGEEREEEEGVMLGLTSYLPTHQCWPAPSTQAPGYAWPASSRTRCGAAPSPQDLLCLPGPQLYPTPPQSLKSLAFSR